MALDVKFSDILVQMSRLGLQGRPQDVQAFIRKSIRRVRELDPDVATSLSELLALAPTGMSPLRDIGGAIVPVDADSRLALAKSEYPVSLDRAPILNPGLSLRLGQVIAEQGHLAALEAQGLGPTRSLLFVGPPGVGKTMSAKWLAKELDRPLITLDLATVMSSYLGKTGSNIRSVLEYAKSLPSVLLLDEFDAIAKKRDDDGDVGELKRLVTVILQEVDDWPSSSLLIAATNHGELLDPAVWRRFDDVLEFDPPSPSERVAVLSRLFGDDQADLTSWIPLMVNLWSGRSYSDLTRTVQWLRRRATITGESIQDVLLEHVGTELRAASPPERKRAAAVLLEAGYSERRISELVGISRDTLRKQRLK